MVDDAAKRDTGGIINVRPYVSSDRDRCVAIAVSAWPGMSSGLPGETASDFWGMLIDMTADYSDLHEVACTSDSVVGLLFGRRAGSPSMRESIRLAKILLSSIRSISRKLSLRESISMCCTLALTETKVMLNTPKCDGEVAFLAIDPEFQGRGIGHRLLESFVSQARSSGVSSISVYTTDPGCNWGFYERHGFRRVAQFGDDFGTKVEGHESTGLMFVLELQE